MAKKRLLAIDDDHNIAELVTRVGEELGFATHAAYAKEVFSVYDDFKPDVIVLDIFMPEMDGFEVLQFLKERKSKAIIVVLSGSHDCYRRMADHLGSVLELMVYANLRKPFRINELRQILTEIRMAYFAEDASPSQQKTGLQKQK